LEADFGAQVANLKNQGADSTCYDAILSIPISYAYLPWAVNSSSQLVDVLFYMGNFAITSQLSGGRVRITAADMAALHHCPAFTGNGYTLNGESLGQADLSNTAYLRTPYYTGVNVDDNGAALPAGGYKRLKEGIERFFITDINNPAGSAVAQSSLPVMFDGWSDSGLFAGVNSVVVFNHVPGGCNVLYMDGHVEYVKYKSKFPVMNSGSTTLGATLSLWMSAAAGIG
jgi:prepilin-type processing-associated H-X9-DG protein